MLGLLPTIWSRVLEPNEVAEYAGTEQKRARLLQAFSPVSIAPEHKVNTEHSSELPRLSPLN